MKVHSNICMITKFERYWVKRKNIVHLSLYVFFLALYGWMDSCPSNAY